MFDLPLDELRRYAPAVREPADFDAFWRARLAAETARPVLLDVRPEPTDLRLVDSWDVTFAGFGGDPVRAWYTRPAGVDGPLPVVVEYVGYGRGRGLPHERLTWPVAGYAHLLMDARGQSGRYGSGDTADPHAGTAGGPSPVTWGILDPQGYYYRRLIDGVAFAAGRPPPRTSGPGVSTEHRVRRLQPVRRRQRPAGTGRPGHPRLPVQDVHRPAPSHPAAPAGG
ncbi:acetylxylan esterase [Micromonospora chersina]|uniref:acetylxylan esterase n=1 Tax=Micromonospora chersina TaxID=47854 RepID=UPI0033CE9A0F